MRPGSVTLSCNSVRSKLFIWVCAEIRYCVSPQKRLCRSGKGLQGAHLHKRHLWTVQSQWLHPFGGKHWEPPHLEGVAAQFYNFCYMGFENGVGSPPIPLHQGKKASDPVRLWESLPVDSPPSLFCVVPSVEKKPLCFSLKSPHLCCRELVLLVPLLPPYYYLWLETLLNYKRRNS